MIDDMESITAKLCSFARAYHSNHEKNKIFDDYLAYDLMGKEEYDEIGQLIEHEYDKNRFDLAYTFSGKRIRDKLNRYISPIPLSRAAFAERELTRFTWQRGKCQYVICGAGMDTFAFRNDNPNIQVFEIDQHVWYLFEIIFIEHQNFQLIQVGKRLGQAMELIFRHIHAFALQSTDVLGQFFDAIAAQKDSFDLGKVADIRFVQSQLVEIQADFFQTIKFRNPSWDMTNLVALQIEIFQMLATTDARWNVCQLAVRQVQTFDVVVLRKVDVAKTASVEGDNLQTVGQKQGLVHLIRFDTGKSGDPHLIVFG